MGENLRTELRGVPGRARLSRRCTCTFQDGAVTGVGMYAYHKMGAGNGVWSRFSGVKPPLAVEAVNVSAASLFRKASDTAGLPTILYD
jgi:hypothetical protein